MKPIGETHGVWYQTIGWNSSVAIILPIINFSFTLHTKPLFSLHVKDMNWKKKRKPFGCCLSCLNESCLHFCCAVEMSWLAEMWEEERYKVLNLQGWIKQKPSSAKIALFIWFWWNKAQRTKHNGEATLVGCCYGFHKGSWKLL